MVRAPDQEGGHAITTTPSPLQRRTEARRRLLDAAATLIEEQPWSQITVDHLTRQAGLSRTAFYQHFPDRRALILAVLEDLGTDLGAVADVWTTSGTDPAAEHRAAIAALVPTWVRHGRTLQAVSDAAALDPEVRAAWDGLTRSLVELMADGIRRDVAVGHSDCRDPEQMAIALSALMENYLLKSFGRRPLADPEPVAETLSSVVVRALYGADL